MADARYAIGLLYWNGKGVQQDYQKAAKWMKDAAEIGHGEAQLKLGYMHINGQGVPQDPGKAEGWLSQSAQQGNMDAQYNLAVLYYKGLAGEPDVEKARYWFAKAAEQGDKVSKRVLKDLAQPGQSLAIDQAANQGGSTVAAVASQTPKVASREEPVSTTIQKGRFTEGSLNPPRWLAKQSDGNYTIQVLASSSEAGINKVVNQHRGFGPFGYYTKNKQGQRLYVLVQGVYSDAESAKRAVAALPADLQKNKPYPVRIGKLRQHLN
jgi:TPR repeat protein